MIIIFVCVFVNVSEITLIISVTVTGFGGCYFRLQPVGFVTFSSRADAEAAMDDLQVGVRHAFWYNDRLHNILFCLKRAVRNTSFNNAKKISVGMRRVDRLMSAAEFHSLCLCYEP